MSKYDGGPAFPETRPGAYGTTAGLTKRDYFAIQFAAAMVLHSSSHSSFSNRDEVAERAGEFADALLRRLNDVQGGHNA